METPKVIYLQEPTKFRTEKEYDNDVAYFSEDAVRDAVIDMLNYANIDNYDEAMAYLINKLKGKQQ